MILCDSDGFFGGTQNLNCNWEFVLKVLTLYLFGFSKSNLRWVELILKQVNVFTNDIFQSINHLYCYYSLSTFEILFLNNKLFYFLFPSYFIQI